MALEVATPAPAPIPAPERNLVLAPAVAASVENHKKNRIQVSNTKKPLFFYVNLAKVRLSLDRNETFSPDLRFSRSDELICLNDLLYGSVRSA